MVRLGRVSPSGVAVAAVLAVAATGLVACGGDDARSEDRTTPTQASASANEAFAGTNASPPKDGPAAQRGKDVWVISCGEALESCSVPTASAREAADVIGWDVTVFDGKLDPATYNAGIREALAAGADGIVLNTIDCPLVRGALQEARRAGVPVVALYTQACDDDKKLFTSVGYGASGTTDYPAYVEAWATAKADWLSYATDGKAKIIDFAQTDLPTTQLIEEGFRKGVANACGGCEIVATVEFTSADIGPRLQQRTEQAILKHPDANAVHAPHDSAMTLGIGPGIQASGRGGELAVIGGEGFPSNIELIREGIQQDAVNALPNEWVGFASIDTLNRLFAGGGPVPQGLGWQLVDADHNMPEAGPYEPDVDFRAAYERVWSGE